MKIELLLFPSRERTIAYIIHSNSSKASVDYRPKMHTDSREWISVKHGIYSQNNVTSYN